jgi:hypothetical protein
MSENDFHRAPRIRKLNSDISNLMKRRGITVQLYARAAVREAFADQFEATTKQQMARTIALQIPALDIYLPPKRKPWMSEHERMGIFEAAALGWMYCHSGGGGCAALHSD